MTKVGKIFVSKRALLARINRRIGKDGLRLLGYSERWRDGWRYAPYIEVDWETGKTTGWQIDLEAYARALGVLKDFEAVVQRDA
jgi:hypothetical protein